MSKKTAGDVKNDIGNHKDILVDVLNRVATLENGGSISMNSHKWENIIIDMNKYSNNTDMWNSSVSFNAPRNGKVHILCTPSLFTPGSGAFGYRFYVGAYVNKYTSTNVNGSAFLVSRDTGRDDRWASLMPPASTLPNIDVKVNDSVNCYVNITKIFGGDTIGGDIYPGSITVTFFWT